jgi:hypothetical protein
LNVVYCFEFFGNWICFHHQVQWLRLSLSIRSNWIGISPPLHQMAETYPVSEKVLETTQEDGQCLKQLKNGQCPKQPSCLS